MVISTFLSDLFLSIVSLWIASRFWALSSVAARASFLGFGIIGISAGLGSLHFAGLTFHDPLYHFFVAMSGAVAVPLIGLAFFHLGIKSLSQNFFLIKVLSMTIGFLIFTYVFPFGLYQTIVGAVSMLVVIIVCLKKIGREQKGALLGLLGAVLFIVAGLVIGTKGARGPILNVDIFHVMLAFANYALGTSIQRLK
ncbi:putative membrane protein [Leptospira ryugenii]|uniref:Putative membrane protein n=1 Tax=Leptospira ryugenii TaxID=1917863 RepID=A0A2P2DYE6_9LEPT|nr:hypothetical protein [Leptospira ryugenii]GBF49658.1 putative membrane protein [Leptospira ryugenii]